MVSVFFQQFFDNWKHRNGVLHGTTVDEQTAIKMKITIRKITALYDIKESLLRRDQDEIFGNLSLQQRIALPLSDHDIFLNFANNCMERAIRERDAVLARQPLITRYFQPRTHPTGIT